MQLTFTIFCRDFDETIIHIDIDHRCWRWDLIPPKHLQSIPKTIQSYLKAIYSLVIFGGPKKFSSSTSLFPPYQCLWDAATSRLKRQLVNWTVLKYMNIYWFISGQITMVPKPELRAFWWIPFLPPSFAVTSASVALICPVDMDHGESNLPTLVWQYHYLPTKIHNIIPSCDINRNMFQNI